LTFDQWCLAGNENDFQSRVAWIWRATRRLKKPISCCCGTGVQ
jgi:hypothetical protein